MNLPQIDSPGSSVFDLPIQPAPVFRPLATPSRQYPSISTPSFIVLSGGTGGNAICSAFGLNATYVLPVSDDGGSSSEIIRVLGGPSVGAILVRIPCVNPYLTHLRRYSFQTCPSHSSRTTVVSLECNM